jgi:hypothetical protein
MHDILIHSKTWWFNLQFNCLVSVAHFKVKMAEISLILREYALSFGKTEYKNYIESLPDRHW